MRWKLRNELEIKGMRWRVDQGPCKLDLRNSSVLRVEKGPCKLDPWDSSVLRVENGPCKLDSWDFKCAKS